MDELLAASELLGSALARYAAACCDITKLYRPDNEKLAKSCVIMNSITYELQTMTGYEAEIQTAKAALSRCRNTSPTIVPINTLPLEVLAQVFTLLRTSSGDCLTHEESGVYDQGDSEGTCWMMPHVVSKVCFRWRQIVVGLQEFWSHIDIVTSHQRHANLLSRARLYNARAGSAPLSLHICNPDQGSAMGSTESILLQMEETFSLLAPKTERFRLDSSHTKGEGTSSLLSYFLRYAEPGMLRDLFLFDHADSSLIDFLKFKDSSHLYPEGWARNPLSLSTRSVNKRLRSIEVLWLRNIFFPWSCHAYIGLTDLRLIVDREPTETHAQIRISQLLKILSSSPGLCSFHCNLVIKIDNTQSTASHVTLKELEVVNLHLMAANQSTRLLTHISPGEKLLELSISISGDRKRFTGRLLVAPILDFFRRSQVTRLFLHKCGMSDEDIREKIPVSLSMMLSELPISVCTLGLNRFRISHETEELTSGQAQIDTVYMYSCAVDGATLQALSRIRPLRKLMLNFVPRWFGSGNEKLVREEVNKLASVASCAWVPPGIWKDWRYWR